MRIPWKGLWWWEAETLASLWIHFALEEKDCRLCPPVWQESSQSSQGVKSGEKKPPWFHNIFPSLWSSLNQLQARSWLQSKAWMNSNTKDYLAYCLKHCGLICHSSCWKYSAVVYSSHTILVRQARRMARRTMARRCWSHGSNRAKVWQMKYRVGQK